VNRDDLPFSVSLSKTNDAMLLVDVEFSLVYISQRLHLMKVDLCIKTKLEKYTNRCIIGICWVITA